MKTTTASLRSRLAKHRSGSLAQDLDAYGYARIPALLTPHECDQSAALYEDESLFRKTVQMESHRYGQGEYRYFDRPLPPLVQALRTALYPPLATIANDWNRKFGMDGPFENSLRAFTARCHAHDQRRPTPLLLRYDADGFNALHQDVYGEIVFPLQVVVLLSDPEREFRGGEFLLVENRPRQQSRGEAIALDQGEALVFPTRERPLETARGISRAKLQHGLSRVRSGRRLAMGIIFHDAS